MTLRDFQALTARVTLAAPPPLPPTIPPAAAPLQAALA